MERIDLNEKSFPGPWVIPVRQAVNVALESCPSTGYLWSFKTEGEGGLELSDASMESVRHESGEGVSFGGSSPQSWSFLTQRPGRVALVFELRRPWEEGVPPQERVVFDLLIATD